MTALIDNLKKIVADVTSIHVNELDITSSLADYGFDSISLTRLANEIYTKLGLETTPAILLECRTITDITRHLETLPLPSASPVNNKMDIASAGITTPVYDDIFSVDASQPTRVSECVKSPPLSKDIAIIGLSGEFAGAANPDALWEMLANGDSAVSSPPQVRNNLFINEKTFDQGWPDYKVALIDDIDKFDAGFFNISGREAKHLDPQQRLLLKHSWIALEEAGCDIDALAGKNVGVFVGISTADYRTILESAEHFDGHYTTGTAQTMAANRISWFLGLTGPSIAVDTACSSSLIALHQAVSAINNGECEMAIVGGANAILHPGTTHACMQAGMLSKSGACRAFDASADGYIRGEGCGVIIIKSMKQAAIDKDTIHAVIKGTATNHGGFARSLTVPNSDAQANVVSAALKQANLSLDDITYIEAHGTGTRIGDPVEINGLKHLLRDSVPRDDFKCGIGSVKGNIGHLEAAAGMAGLIKTILMFRHRQLPTNTTFHTLNPYIDLKGSPWFIVDKTQPWETGGLPRRAGISSFGLGGSNAHVILQEPERLPYSEPCCADNVFWCLFSAAGPQQLQRHVADVIDHLKNHADLPLARLAYNLRIKKSQRERLAIVAADTHELINKLNQWLQRPEATEGVLSGADTDTREFVRLASRLSISPEDLSEFFITKKNLTVLIKLWLSGFAVRWSSLFTEKYRKIALPCRPFNPQSWWVDLPTPLNPSSDTPSRANLPAIMPEVKHQLALSPVEYSPHPAPAETTAPVKIALPALSSYHPSCVPEAPNRMTSVSSALSALLISVLECPQSEACSEKTFSEMGLDSILAVEFIGKVNQQFSLSLNASTLYEYVTLPQLARYINDMGIAEQKEIAAPSCQAASINTVLSSPPTLNVADEISVRDTLKILLADALGTESSSIDEDKPFSEMGLDSILGVDFISKVNQRFKTDLKAESLYEHICLSRLLPHITVLSDSVPEHAMADILQQVWKGTLSMDEADKQLSGANHA